MLPREVRDDVYLLYLVFRTLDDLVDERHPDAAARGRRRQRVGGRRARGRHARGRGPRRPRRAGTTCRAAPWSTSVAGWARTWKGVEYETEADVDRYCYRVAGTVGVVMAAVLGTDAAERARPAAAALGMAMQRTNILRDIDEDAANGRVYIARRDLARYGGASPRASASARCATRSPAPTRSTTGPGRDRRAAPRAPRDRRRGRHVPRDVAPARTGRLRRARRAGPWCRARRKLAIAARAAWRA